MRSMRITLALLGVMMAGCQASQPLFNGRDLSGWTEVGSQGAWSVKDGVLVCSGAKDGYAWLSTDEKFGDYTLTLEWRIEPEGNTGVFNRAPDREGRTSMKGFEVQARDDRQDTDLSDACGAVFSRIPASGRYARPPGEWNTLAITCRGRQVRIVLNDHLVSDTVMDTIESMKVVPDAGYIGLQNHGSPAEFRNVRIVELK